MNSKYLVIAFICAVVLILSTSTSARVINVPEDFQTIQAAIEASENDDIVLVAPGIYRETIDLLGRMITVTSHIHLDDNPDFIAEPLLMAMVNERELFSET